MRHIVTACVIAMLGLACRPGGAGTRHETVVGLPCEGCEAVFDGMPDSLAWSARIAARNEPGDPMRIQGVARDESGRPVAGIVVYAYHTDAHGIYPRDDRFSGYAARHGRLRAWALTDAQGRYRFDTIRPGGYPGTDIPQHVHMHVIEPGRCTYYIDDIHFEDDPRLTESTRTRLQSGRGGSGLVRPVGDAEGTWLVTRHIALGGNVPGYPKRPRRRSCVSAAAGRSAGSSPTTAATTRPRGGSVCRARVRC
jgi:protocatechuate 3,4-dioxygenase beta subunit